MAKVRNFDTTFVNAVETQTSDPVAFEHTAGSLKNRTVIKSDDHNIAVFFKDKGGGIPQIQSQLSPEQIKS